MDCGLLDRSERGKLALTGEDRKAFLNGQVTNDVEALAEGEGCYAAFLTPKGKMLGDLRILDAGDELLLDTERVALQPLFDMIRRFSIGHRVELHKRTVERGLLSLVGADPGEFELPPVEHAHRLASVGERPVRVVVTDEGVDVLCDAGDTDTVRAALLDGGARAMTDDEAEILRVERGRPRYGVDLDESVIPQEAGLNDRAVSFTKGCYVGQETVARLHYKGKPNRHLRGIRLREEAAPGTALHLGDREVGRITTAVVSPTLGPIALGFVRREAEPGTELDLGEVVELPFA